MMVQAQPNASRKLQQIYRFLQDLNDLRNPVQADIRDQPWIWWLEDLPSHPAIRLGRRDGEEDLDDHLIKVARPSLGKMPAPPDELLPWLLEGWDKVDQDVEVRQSRDVTAEDGTSRTVQFDEDSDLQVAVDEWKLRRAAWVEKERPGIQANRIYERLYELQARIERESERVELVLGDGLISWRLETGNTMFHPVLLQRLVLTFDPKIPEFTLSDSERPPELYSALFRRMPEVSAAAIARIKDKHDSHGCHPLDGEPTTEFFREAIAQLSSQGQLVGHEQLLPPGPSPRIARRPVIFLRSRTLGYSLALESILRDLETRQELPRSVLSIAGISREPRAALEDDHVSIQDSPNGEDSQVLFTKAANAEQLEIARRLQKHRAVLVQGPPGTGKTHTIGNLVGHLLAQGKSVLITSHTTKALRVVRDQVAEPLRDLCVSVLDSDITSRKQLEDSIDGIHRRLSESDADHLEREAAALRAQREDLLRRLTEKRKRLEKARADEYTALIIAGREYTPSEAARVVAQGESQHDWIPAPVLLGNPLPLSVGEIAELYRTNHSLTPDHERELSVPLPATSELPSPSEFESLIMQCRRLDNDDLGFRKDLWDAAVRTTAEEMSSLTDSWEDVTGVLRGAKNWELVVIQAGRDASEEREIWEDLLRLVDSVHSQAARAKAVLLDSNPELPGDYSLTRAGQVLEEIITRLGDSGRVARPALWFRADWRELIGKARVNGRSPESASDFRALKVLVSLRLERQRLLDRWTHQVTSLGGPSPDELGPEPEAALFQLSGYLRDRLNWFSLVWKPYEEALQERGLKWSSLVLEIPPNLSSLGYVTRHLEAVTRLPAILQAQLQRLSLGQVEQSISTIVAQLERYITSLSDSVVVQQLRTAMAQRNPVSYRAAFERRVDLEGRSRDLRLRQVLLQRLEAAAPGWASALRERRGIHGSAEPPGDPASAWLWRQMHDELEARAATSLEELQSQILDLSERLPSITTWLVERLAWSAQVRRTTPEQRQALGFWSALIRKGSKGSKLAPWRLAEARKLMPFCQSAVPVWIMPLNRVVETFDPSKNHFDVVIIDEASQSDVMALTALYLGEEVIVVGDHEQVSPDAIGMRLDEVKQLIEANLQGIPGAAMYDGQTSIYDLARASFPGVVCLTEHFRCVTPIINFSNALSYDWKIRPLRDSTSAAIKPATVAYRVEEGIYEDKVNKSEALTVASLVVAACEQPEYRNATFGVISLIGDEQAMYIDGLLRRFMDPAEIDRRRIRCGNSAQFQGDERQVMFLSVVSAVAEKRPLPLMAAGANDSFKKRVNVAASRARDQMWVVHSLQPDVDLQPEDLRRRLIEHARDPENLATGLSKKEGQAESEFERQVLRRLYSAGYQVTPQWRVGAYRIDMVVEGSGKRLAVECDGDRWHPAEKIAEDMARQAILERLGWRFVRIRGSVFFRNPDRALKPVFERLNALGIKPEGAETPDPDSRMDDEVSERVIRRSAEFRRQWATLDVLDVDGPRTSKRPPGPPRKSERASVHPRPQPVTEPTSSSDPTDTTPPKSVHPVPPAPASRPTELPQPQVESPGPATAARAAEPSREGKKPVMPAPPASGGTDVQAGSGKDFVALLRTHGLELVDKRQSGGCLWVVGGAELASLMEELKGQGVRFSFAASGGRATRHRPAWFIK